MFSTDFIFRQQNFLLTLPEMSGRYATKYYFRQNAMYSSRFSNLTNFIFFTLKTDETQRQKGQKHERNPPRYQDYQIVWMGAQL